MTGFYLSLIIFIAFNLTLCQSKWILDNECTPKLDLQNVDKYWSTLQALLTWEINSNQPNQSTAKELDCSKILGKDHIHRFILFYTESETESSENNFSYRIQESNYDINAMELKRFFGLSVNFCYLECIIDFDCIAISYNKSSTMCTLKTNKSAKDEKTDCPNDFICNQIEENQTSYLFDLGPQYFYQFKVLIFWKENQAIDEIHETMISNLINLSTIEMIVVYNISHFKENEEGIIRCETKIINSEISWYKNDTTLITQEIAKNENISINNDILRFLKLNHITNYGNYSCKQNLPDNRIIQSKNFEVKIEHGPVLKIMEGEKVIKNKTEDLILTCVLDSFPLKSFKWILPNGLEEILYIKNINYSASEQEIRILNLKSKESGTYRCCDEHSYCEYVEVIVQSEPSMPVELNASYYQQEDELHVEWDVNNQNLVITDGIVQLHQNEINSTISISDSCLRNKSCSVKSFTKFNLFNDLYLSLILKNALGSSDKSAQVMVSKYYSVNDIGPNYFGIVIPVVICIILIIFLIVISLRKMEKRAEKKVEVDFIEDGIEFNNFDMRGRMITQSKFINSSFDEENSESVTSIEINDDQDNIFVSEKKMHRKLTNIQIFKKHHKKAKLNENNEANLYSHYSIGRSRSLKELNDNWIKSVKENKLDDEFEKEFNSIKSPSYLKSNLALLEKNLPKSRNNSYPYDFNRVKLKPIEGIECSDFINASYIEVKDKTKKFIAAQSPSKNTIDDFIRMVIQKQIKVMVMLCKFREGTPSKANCYPFFNDLVETKIGNDYIVYSVLLENKCTFAKRTLTIREVTTSRIYNIDLYQYTEWPEKGVPDEAESVIGLIEQINSEQPNQRPILVFCNTGCGRTGTFIVLDILLETLNQKQEINIRELVSAMRIQRRNFVETWEQYKFISYALLQRYIFGKTVIPKQLAEIELVRLNEVAKDEKKTKMEVEYLKLTNFKNTQKPNEIYLGFSDKFTSNKFYPYDDSIIEISSKSRSATNSFEATIINATDFKPSQIDIEFVILADPSSEGKGFEDYLTLLFLRKPNIIISLSTELQNLPKPNESIEINNYKITNLKTVNEKHINLQTLEFQKMNDNNNNSNKLLIHYFDLTSNWVSQTTAEPKNKDLFINTINKFLNLSDMKFTQSYTSVNVFVQSADAGDRCGVFIASSILFNSLSVANQFDVAQIVRQLRATRANMISTYETYKLLYELCFLCIKNMEKLILLTD